MINLRQLDCFVAVAECENLAGAALRLNISASPLSRQILALEERLGLQLFERSRQRLFLTEAGQAFLDEARTLLAHAARVENSARALGRGEIGRVTVGYVEAAVHTGVLAAAIRGLRRHFPDIEVQLQSLRSAQQLSALLDREIDFGLLHTPPDNVDRLVCEPVCEDALLLAVPASDALAAADSVLPEQLDGRVWITRRRSLNPSAHERFLAACRAAGFSPDNRFEADDVLTLLGIVGAGLAVGLVQASVCHIVGPDVVLKPIPWFPQRVPIHLAHRHGDGRPAIEVLRNMVLDTAGPTSRQRQHTV
ncbi:LysR family transcriptional regulator [Burkholderia sp. NLJ2]|uniref:LysR family transcriptional regulator n=1 Tax=Burkholderia sp. NLJ2 TaxID=3090699 RepID=UPI003C6BE5B0